MSHTINWFDFEGKEQISTPALVVYPQRISSNIYKVLEIAGNAEKLMPHVKTHKMTAVVEMQLKAGITKFKCATIAEAEMCAQAGAEKVLLAYPLNLANAHRFFRLTQKYPDTDFLALVDSLIAAEQLNNIFQENDAVAEVLIDVNVGMNRTGILANAVPSLCKAMIPLNSLSFRGLHAYDGHIHDSDRSLRFQKAQKAIEPVINLRNKLEKESGQKLMLVAGGSGTFPFYAQLNDVLCSPGTPFFWDAGYSQLFPDLDFDIAALLLPSIVSQPTENTYCLDLGYKAVAAENPLPRVVFPELPDAEVLFQSEEHLVIKSDAPLEIGKTIFASPIHICPSVALYDEAYTIENGKVSGSWEVIARKRKITV